MDEEDTQNQSKYSTTEILDKWNSLWKNMCIEYSSMEEKKVWEICKKNHVPTGRKIFEKKNEDKETIWTHQPKFTKYTNKNFGSLIKSGNKYQLFETIGIKMKYQIKNDETYKPENNK